MSQQLNGRRIAIIASDGFEQSELETPRDVLREAGANVDVIALRAGSIQGFEHLDKGQPAEVDATIDSVEASDYDALVIPGGLYSPDEMRTNSDVIDFARAFFDADKLVAALCHGPWVLISADLVRGRRMTSYPSILTDVENAGAQWIDAEVVVDRGLITSRSPDDLDAFCNAIIDALAGDEQGGASAPGGN